MAAPYNPPVKGEDFLVRVFLQDFALPGSFRVNPTLAAGDFKVDIDGAGYNNFATLPTVSPASTTSVLVSLSAAEMNGDIITIAAIDQTANKEWADLGLCIQTTA